MAFGLGFNKTKVLSAAEKYVQQGKLPNAISEYEKVLKNDAKDLTVMNTVGDLYARLGQTDQACTCFKNVGDAYAQQGFTVKAIAMYKKLTKLKSSLEGVLKLAELYTQQGLFNDARQQYLQVAEEFLRSGELEQAVRIFQKTLEMDPENVAMKVRLAEVYVRLGKKNEAWQVFSSAADQLRSRGQVGPAEDILQRMLTLDPSNNQALLMRGRNSLEAGDPASAIQYLQKVPDLEKHPDAMKSLFQAYLGADRLSDAGALATRMLNVHDDVEGLSQFVDALMRSGLYQDALNIYQQYSERLMSAGQAKVLENLHTIIGHVRNDPASLELLLDLFQKAGETTHVSEVIELLAHASVQTGDLRKAQELYQQLATVEPQNPIHAQNFQQVSAKLGDSPRGEMITAEEGAVLVDELEATAPSIDQEYSEDVSASLRAALTDAELFVSYNMPAKAMGPLLAVLPQAPQDLRLNQRLAALHTRAGRFAEAAVCCRSLETVYSQYGYAEEAGRYGELAGRYEHRSGTAASASAASGSSSSWPAASLDTRERTAVEEPEIEIIDEPESFAIEAAEFTTAQPVEAGHVDGDLTDEWETSFEAEPAIPEAPSLQAPAQEPMMAEVPQLSDEDLVVETVEEIRFYLQQSMRLQALAAMAKLEALSKDEGLISSLRGEYEAAFAPAPVAQPVRAQEAAEDEFAIEVEEAPVQDQVEQVSEHHSAMAEVAEAAGPTHGDLDEIVADLESSLGDGFGPAPATSKEQHARLEEVEVASATPRVAHVPSTLGEFVADLESSLPEDLLPVPAAAKPSASRSAAAAANSATAPVTAQIAPAAVPAPISRSAVHPDSSTHATAAAASAPIPAGGFTDLSLMFEDLKSELEEDATATAAESDPETHYNLGVAFREMGLLDEAIGELQKVCHLADKGNSFPQLMQTYTWLAQCFLDKGVPEAAIRWYERALKIPTIDDDTRTALHYELATAHETAQHRDAALGHFMEVYGTNIDYRDVAERIKALKS